MNAKERLRIKVLAKMAEGSMSLGAGAIALGISYRQMRRVRRRHGQDGDAGLVHRLRGKVSNRQSDSTLKQRVLDLCRGQYEGFGPTLVSEYLLNLSEPVTLSHDTIRRWMVESGLLTQRRRRAKHRLRRERRSRRGELVQMDGSWHDWFEGRGDWCCLMVMIDDATGAIFARFYDRETLISAFDLFGRYAAEHGLPEALYVDRAGIYRSDKEPTLEQELAQERPLTQFGRAMKTLEVELILANSPQAKGRVERMNGTLQDRLVKAMRLKNVGDIRSANQFLEESFLSAFNKHFAITAADTVDAHRMAAVKLGEVLCEHHERKVGRDWCVQWHGALLQIDKIHERLNLPGKTITLRALADGPIQLLWQTKVISSRVVTRRPQRPKPKRQITNNKGWKPPASHPWKSGLRERDAKISLAAPMGAAKEILAETEDTSTA